MEKNIENITYFIGFLLICFILYSLFSSNDEHFTIFPWNIPTRLGNYLYDIRGYPSLFTCYDRLYNIPYPCMYLYNNKYDVEGKYVRDPLYSEYKRHRMNNIEHQKKLKKI